MRAVTVPEVSVLRQPPSRLAASVQAVVVVFVWATSWILIKGKLHDIAALSFAGLRYGLAFVCLLALLLGRPALRSSVVALPRRSWLRLGTLGLLLYGLTQATVFLGLYRLPAVTVSLLLSVTPALVTVLAIPLLGEVPTPVQGGGVLLSLAGTLVYFGPVALPAGQLVAIGVVAVGVIAFAAATMLGRSVNRDDGLPALTVTVVSMGIGSGLLLAVAVVHDGIPRLTPSSWLVVLWLAVINTALAFTVWNHTMRRLSAMESSLINNTMLVHVAVLAWIFLGERPNARAMLGLVLVAGGVVLVQRRRVGNRQATPQAHQQSGGQGTRSTIPSCSEPPRPPEARSTCALNSSAGEIDPNRIARVFVVPFIGPAWVVVGFEHGDWGPAGGGLEPGESFQAALERELAEEAGARLLSYTPFAVLRCHSGLSVPTGGTSPPRR